jgi:glycosyltransferase involved in cell wall biosynthesis
MPSPEYSLTVIIPIFNEERYLTSTLTSIENATRQCIDNLGFEPRVIASDNASTDSSYTILKYFKERNPKWEIRSRTLKVSGTEHFKSLITEVDTEYLSIIGAHDRISKSYFKDLLEVSIKYPNSPIYFGDEYLDSSGKAENALRILYSYNFSKKDIERFWQSILYLGRATCIQGLVRTRWIQNIHVSNTAGSDLVWLHGLLKYGPITYVEKANYIRTNPIRNLQMTTQSTASVESSKNEVGILILNSWCPYPKSSIFYRLARYLTSLKYSQHKAKDLVFRILRKGSLVLISRPVRKLVVRKAEFSIETLVNQ